MITISFYSYKGGVGRSLALTNLAVYLVQFGVTVVMADFDLEAPGLQYKIQPGSNPIDVSNGGLAAFLASASTGTAIADLNYDMAIDITRHVESPPASEEDLDQPRGRLYLIPAGDPLQPEYWTDLANIDWKALFTRQPRPGLAAFDRLRKYIIDAYNPDLLLIDSRTGITPSAGVSTTLLPDVVVSLLLNTPEHIDGSRVVISGIIGQDTQLTEPPRVVPVLSRYTPRDFPDRLTAAEMRRRRLIAPSRVFAELQEEHIPLAGLRAALIKGLSEESAGRVAEPLVLHTDLDLQGREYLSFGRYAEDRAADTTGTLLDDYLRLFASLVPRELVTRHLSGVRNRVRAVILDRPDDAVRTLESLAALVGDEDVFVDLIKVYILRRDVASMLRAAARLYSVHNSIVVDPSLSDSLRDILVARSPRNALDVRELSAEFLEAYWRRAAPDDIKWGAAVARTSADLGRTDSAQQLCEELISVTSDAAVLAELVEGIANGGHAAEQLAATLALRYFDLGQDSIEFLVAAARACKYQPSPQLATRIVEATEFSAVPELLAIEILQAAGRRDEAGMMLVDVLASGDHDDEPMEHIAELWTTLIVRNRELRNELERRNPAIAATLDSVSEDRPRSTRRRRPSP